WRELLAGCARRIAAGHVEPDPAGADVLAATRRGEQELARRRLPVALPHLGDAARERAPERRRLGTHLIVEHGAFAAVIEEPLNHRDERNADDERRNELTGQPHGPRKISAPLACFVNIVRLSCCRKPSSFPPT